MGLEALEGGLEAFCAGRKEAGKMFRDKTETVRPRDKLDSRNGELLKEYLLEHFDRVRDVCREQQDWAKAYLSEKLAGASHAAAVDIGWAGSGALGLSWLCE